MNFLRLLISLFALHLAACNTFARPGIERVGHKWTIDTGVLRMEVRVEDGKYLLTSLRNLPSGREYFGAGQVSAEVRLTIDGRRVTGADAGWTFVSDSVHWLEQGEWQLDLTVRRGAVAIEKHYVAYPRTGIIREWLTITNDGAQPVQLQEPYFLCANLQAGAPSDLDLHYVTGGGNYNGSQLLQTEHLSRGFSRIFDSKKATQTEAYSAYLPLVVLRNRAANDGILAGWDYMGHWVVHAGADKASGAQGDLSIKVAGYARELKPGERVDTPKAFLGCFQGGLDALGNSLLDWQYEYLWDFTNEDYFAQTRFAVNWQQPWVGVGGAPSGDNWGRRLALDLRYIDLMRETGSDILWDDAGWYDKWGTWQGPEWRLTTDYLTKYGMKWVLWFPTFLATPGSRVVQEHPGWLIPGELTLEQSIRGTAEWQAGMLAKSVAQWGDFQWRYDGASAASANDTGALDADQNFRWLLETFKASHPASGVDACYGGGRWISYDIARLSESGEYTDGGVGPYSGYYTSLLIPPDKYHNVVDFDHTYYLAASDRTHLAMNPNWYRDPGDGPDVEAIRKDWEIYHYLKAQGVVGRWSHVFRPEVSNDDPIWYFQRMDHEGARGVIITKHARKGTTYLITAQRISGGESDHYLGGPGGASAMCQVSTSQAARIDTGIYEDPVNGARRFYGTPGQLYGPLNLKYQEGGHESSFVTGIVKPGAVQKTTDRFFGMALQVSQPLVVTELGLFSRGDTTWAGWDNRANSGTYRLTILRASDAKVVTSATLEMGAGASDRLGFKYVRLPAPVRLDPIADGGVTIRPGGLQADQLYDVQCMHSSCRAVRTGADLMKAGIRLPEVEPGELIFLNLPNRPGSGSDHVPPTAPGAATKRVAMNLGAQGVEIAWTPATDNNWISYYEVLRDGAMLGRTAKGAFYFDYGGDPSALIHSKYEVRAVDGDGNRGPLAPAREIAGEPEAYRALGGFAPGQASGVWRYEETSAAGGFQAMRWENAGYEGSWRGSDLARIGRIWMQPGAYTDVARVFVVPSRSVLTVDGVIRKDPNAANGRSAGVKVLHNGRQIWPASGWREVDSDSRNSVACHIEPIQAAAGDTLRFVVRRTGDETPEPILWDPTITVRRRD